MIISDMFKLFIDTRKRGTSTATRRAQPKTIKAYEWNIKIILDWLVTQAKNGQGGVTHYREWTRPVLSEMLDWLDCKVQTSEYSDSTRLQILRTLKAFFKWVDADEDCKEESLRGLQRHLPRITSSPIRRKPEAKDIKAFKNSFTTRDSTLGFRDYVAVCLMMSTGMRLGEVCDLKVQDVFLDDRTLEFRAKGGQRRKVSLPMGMVPLLKTWLRRRMRMKRAENSEYVFVSKYSEKMEVAAWGKRFGEHCKKHGLQRVTAHTLRHQFVTVCAKKNTNVANIMAMTGHKSVEMVMRYVAQAELEGKALQDEMDRVNALDL